jgi:DNA-binding IclR family transcriptional regulator
MTLKEICARVGFPKTTVFRYLQTLHAAGLVAHDPAEDLYRIDVGILSLVPRGGSLQRLRDIALPHMRALQERFNETVNLGTVEGNSVVYVEIIESRRSLRMQARVGGRDPIHTTAIGKAILAHLPDKLGRQILPPSLRKRTTRTVATILALARELEQVVALGYAEEEGENEEGAACIGAPIFAEGSAVIAGLSVSAPATRLSADRRRQIAPILLATARRISTTLGFRSER